MCLFLDSETLITCFHTHKIPVKKWTQNSAVFGASVGHHLSSGWRRQLVKSLQPMETKTAQPKEAFKRPEPSAKCLASGTTGLP